MISLEDLPHVDDHKGRIWDLSGFFKANSPVVSLRHKADNARSAEPITINTKELFSHTSRSYSGRYVAEVFARSRCGIDLETLKPAETNWSIDSPLFEMAMLAPGEKQLIKESVLCDHENLPTLIWASKEALAKALGDAKNYEPTRLLSPITWALEPKPNWSAEHQEFLTHDEKRLIVWLVVEDV